MKSLHFWPLQRPCPVCISDRVARWRTGQLSRAQRRSGGCQRHAHHPFDAGGSRPRPTISISRPTAPTGSPPRRPADTPMTPISGAAAAISAAAAAESDSRSSIRSAKRIMPNRTAHV